MKLIVNHKGVQSLVVSKPDVAVLEKARGLLNLAATFLDVDQQVKDGMKFVIDHAIAIGTPQADDQTVLFDKNADDDDEQPPA